MSGSGSSVLELSHVSAGYGPITVLDDLSLQLRSEEVLTVLGTNGSGKSTVLKTVMGLTRVSSGQITLGKEEITRTPPDRRAAAGLGYVPQNQNVFPDLTVADNLRMGSYLQPRSHAEDLVHVLELFPQLEGRGRDRAGNLSGGERRMLSIGLTLLLKPKLLLLDEPSSDLSPLMVDLVFSAIRRIHEDLGIPVLLVEQNVDKALSLADRVIVLVRGREALDAPAGEVGHKELHRLFLDGSVGTDRS